MENLQQNFDIINTGVLEPLARIFSEPAVQVLARETARDWGLSGAGFYLSNSMITVNGWLALLGVAIIGSLLLKLFFGLTLFDVMDAMTGSTGYGSSYGAPDAGYGAPASGAGYGSTAAGYGAPSSGYSSRSDLVELTQDQKELYPELTQLQDQLRSVQDAELNLRRHILHQEVSPELPSAAGQIGYSY